MPKNKKIYHYSGFVKNDLLNINYYIFNFRMIYRFSLLREMSVSSNADKIFSILEGIPKSPTDTIRTKGWVGARQNYLGEGWDHRWIGGGKSFFEFCVPQTVKFYCSFINKLLEISEILSFMYEICLKNSPKCPKLLPKIF